VAWLRTLGRIRSPVAASGAWVAGAAAWVVAQLFEKLENHGDVLVHPWMTLPEETLEMAGSSVFGLALLLWIQHQAAEVPLPASEAPRVLTPRADLERLAG
jgi:hypothetical protein